jgi:hypothetical protein
MPNTGKKIKGLTVISKKPAPVLLAGSVNLFYISVLSQTYCFIFAAPLGALFRAKASPNNQYGLRFVASNRIPNPRQLFRNLFVPEH